MDCRENKCADSCMFSMQHELRLCFAYAKSRFSYDTAHFVHKFCKSLIDKALVNICDGRMLKCLVPVLSECLSRFHLRSLCDVVVKLMAL